MTRKLTFLILALFALIAGPSAKAWGQEKADTYERLTSIANIDESAQYVLGIDGTGFHYEGISSWGKTALPSAQTPLYYTLKKAADGQSFTAQTEISNTTYYLQVPTTSNTFGMAESTGTDTDLIIGTTQSNAGDDKNYAVANKGTTTRHLRRNGTSGLRSYASNTGSLAFFYKVVKDEKTLVSIAISGNPDKTTYEAGEEFDPAGLVVTGTYTEGDPEVITSGIDWTITPNPLIAGTTSVSVTAKVGEITSAAYQVNGLTVTAPLPKITITADKIVDFASTYAEYIWTANDVSGKCWAYRGGSEGSYNIQFNKTTYVYNTTAVPGRITSVKMTKVSGTTRSWSIYGADEALTGVNYATAGTQIGSAQEVSDETGTTWNVPNDKNYTYFYITKADGGTNIGEIVITYEEDKTPSIEADVEEIEFDQKELSGTVTDNKTISATGKNLTAPISASMKSGSAAVFSVTPVGTPTAAAGEFTVSYSTTEAGEYAGTVVLSSGETSIEIPVSASVVAHIPVLQSIAISGTPDKTEYVVGDAFETAGLVVTGTYDVGDPQTITEGIEWTVTPSGALADNVTSVSVVATVDGVASEAFNVNITVVELPKWAKVTAYKTDWSGEYLLVYEGTGDDAGKAFVWTGVDAANCNVTATITDDQIIKPATAVSLTIAAMDGGYSILVNGGDNNGKYINQTSYDNGMNISDNPSANTLSYDGTNTVIAGSGASDDAHVTMRYNTASDQLRFRYYKSGQKAVQLYEKVLPPTNEAVTFDAPEGGSLVIKNDGNPITTGTNIQNGTVLDVEFGMTPAEAYKDVAIKVTKTEGGDDVTSTVYNAETKEITMPRYAIKVEVTSTKLYKIEAATVTGGTLSWEDANKAKPTYVEVGTYIQALEEAATHYEFKSFDIYKTGETTTKVEATDGIFEMPAYDVTISGTFDEMQCTALPSAPVLGTPSISYSDGVTLNWNKLDVASGYLVNVWKGTDKIVEDEMIEDVNTISFKITATMDVNTEYSYSIAGLGDDETYCMFGNLASESTFTTADYPAVVLTLSENGITSTIDGKLNTPIDLPTTSTQTCEDKVFVGWSETAIEGEAATATLLDATYTITDSEQLTATIYAVYAKETEGTTTWNKVSTNYTDWNGNEFLIVYESEATKGYVMKEADAVSNYVEATIANGVIDTKPNDAMSVIIEKYGTTNDYQLRVAGENPAKYLKGASGNGLSFDASAQQTTISYDNTNGWLISNNSSWLRYNTTSGQTRFRFYKSTTYTQNSYKSVQLYKKTIGAPTYSNYCTTTPIVISGNIAWNNDVTISGNTVTIGSGAVLTVNGVLTNSTASNLIIEDGGQLICNNAVNATVRKSITAHGTTGGWNFIATPIDGGSAVSAVQNGTYDLYRFNQAADKEWENVKDDHHTDFTTLNNGQGYLYANAATTTLEFAGTLYNGDGVFPLTNSGNGKFAGWNLVGNPFPYNAYASQAYFTLNSDGSAVNAETSNGAIAPCTAVFVQATGENPSVTFSKDAPAKAGSLEISLAQANTKNASRIDNAIVSFGEGQQLEKLYMFGEGSSLYIPQGDKEYAIVSAETEGTLPLCFKTSKNGTYTITVNTENIDAEYIHLIDNMTGMDTDLLSTPSYTFSAKTSDYASRFKLVFNVKDEASASSANDFAYMSDGNLVISNIEGEATLQIVDMMGRVLSTETVSGNYCKALNLRAGVYVLNLNGMTQKIVVE